MRGGLRTSVPCRSVGALPSPTVPMRRLPLAVALFALPSLAHAQTTAAAVAPAEITGEIGFVTAAAVPDSLADTASPEALIAALYDAISGPSGQMRDWARFRRLFAPDGRLVALGKRRDGTVVQRTLTPDDYVTGSGAFLVESGFTERETHRVMHRYGHVVHAFSAYEGTFTNDGQPGTVRGINSIQMIETGGRWRVLTVLWNDEQTAGEPVPTSFD